MSDPSKGASQTVVPAELLHPIANLPPKKKPGKRRRSLHARKKPRTPSGIHHNFRLSDPPAVYTRRSCRLEPGARPRLSRRAALHARHSLDHASRPPVDHAPVRRLRHRRRHQSALPLSARAGPNRPFHGVRSAHFDGLRLRPSALRRRSRQVRRGHQFARRHGSAVRSNSARRTSPLR